ncbi:MAG TPA: hypothetical protein ENJ95_01785 [Bacteroidetes bacterium]|nr:hypothetical protein [Bacteroidota bacterium]
MKNITIPEGEYLRLVQLVQDLKKEIENLKIKYSPVEKKQALPVKKNGSPASRLRGIISLPPDFDHKDFLSDELFASYLSK